MKLTISAALLVAVAMAAGCNQQDTNKTRQQAEQATEKIKEGSKVAAAEFKKDAKEAAKQTKAAAEGVKQGLQSPDAAVNINTASKVQLETLPGVDEEIADRIVAGRPYHTVDEVGARGAVSPDEFNAIKRKISIK